MTGQHALLACVMNGSVIHTWSVLAGVSHRVLSDLTADCLAVLASCQLQSHRACSGHTKA